MKTSELICDKCNKKFAGEKVNAEKIFICGFCSGEDIAGDITRWRPSLKIPNLLKFTVDEISLIVEALYLLAYKSEPEKRLRCVRLIKHVSLKIKNDKT